jgi:prepilin-type N-terminal cleavage/methylation domain-containing protein
MKGRMTKQRRCDTRAGFSLFELLIAVVVLGFAAAGLGKLMLGAAQSGRHAGAQGYRTAILNGEVARITAAPIGSLDDGTTTTTVTSQPLPYILTTVVATSGTAQTVTITVAPTGGDSIAPVTRTIARTLVTTDPF